MVNPDRKKSRGNLTVFLICLAISVFIWFLITLSKESYTSLEYPIEFVNLPTDMVLVNNPDSVLTFRISSGGFELFTLRYLNRKRPVRVDLEAVNLEEQDSIFTGAFLTSRLTASIRKQYSFSEELISISPETIEFRFEPLSGKMVPVKSALLLEFQKQFRLSDTITFVPPQVKVIGPRNLVDALDQVFTYPERVVDISGNISGRVKLEKPIAHEQLTLQPEEVEFRLQADKFTESTLELPVSILSKDVMVKTFPQKVKVTFLVSLSDFKRIDPSLFEAGIVLPDPPGEGTKAKVSLSRIPAFVEVTRIEPEEVDFLVFKK